MSNLSEENEARDEGKARAAAAAIKGLSGVFGTLVEQHGEASALLDRARLSDDPGRRLELWTKVRVELLSHERAELDVVYPVLREYPRTAGFAADHEREAEELEAKIKEIDTIDSDSDDWSPQLQELLALVQQHVADEESEYFPVAMEVIGKDAAAELDDQFRTRKEGAAEELRA